MFKNWFQKKAADKPKPKKSALREWLDALLYAGVAAIIIRTLFIEAYQIPTSSMERSLMVGDFLFVSKFHYGARLPQVPLSIPFVHNRIPFTSGTKSYLDWITLPYLRLPGISEVQRNDAVVFNYPADDIYPNNVELGAVRETSMKENYIKRCVAISGDSLYIKAGMLYVNGQLAYQPKHMQYAYQISVKANDDFNPRILEKYGYRNPNTPNRNYEIIIPGMEYEFQMDSNNYTAFKLFDNVKNIRRRLEDPKVWNSAIYPGNNPNYRWNLDNMGPMLVPKAGVSIAIDTLQLPLYRRIIEVYEGHSVRVQGADVLIDGQKATSYTFEMNYFFMMGDNRNNSMDSRYWGFVPEDHIVGKPLFVLFSVEDGIRWDRFFKGID